MGAPAFQGGMSQKWKVFERGSGLSQKWQGIEKGLSSSQIVQAGTIPNNAHVSSTCKGKKPMARTLWRRLLRNKKAARELFL